MGVLYQVGACEVRLKVGGGDRLRIETSQESVVVVIGLPGDPLEALEEGAAREVTRPVHVLLCPPPDRGSGLGGQGPKSGLAETMVRGRSRSGSQPHHYPPEKHKSLATG